MLVELKNIVFSYTGVPVLSDVSLRLHENERVGLIGGNGEGKTTLIGVVTGRLAADSGERFVKSGIGIGLLEQTGGLESSSTVYAEMERVFDRDRALIEKLREVERSMSTADEAELRVLAAKAESLHRQIEARDSYHFDVRIKTVLNGMGFGGQYDQIVSTMSGGEKTRLKLCRLLLEAPDLLILDEPTNHLDVKTLFWLEDYLNSYKGCLLVVSHDRYFLDRLTSRTIELERGKLWSYKGNYSKYKQLKAERLAVEQKEYEKQREEIAKLQDYVDRNLVRATTAKSAQSRVKQLEKIQPLDKPLPPPPPPGFSFPYAERPGERVLFCDSFTLTAGGKTLVRDGSFLLSRGQKCALVGDNGTGKTTLLKFFLSKDPRVVTGKGVKIAYYDQENADLDPEARVLDAFWGNYSLLSQTEARKLLARSGLQAEDMDKKVKNLSGGERAKLELALLQAKRGNVLFLDEPTNHLDLAAREALEEALTAFDGTILFVSHDRYFIRAIADRVALIEDGRLSFFDGDYEAFLSAQKNLANSAEEPPKKQPTAQDKSYRSKEDRAQEAQRRVRVRQIETELEALEAEETALNERMAGADYEEIRSICDRLEEIRDRSDALYGEYETLI